MAEGGGEEGRYNFKVSKIPRILIQLILQLNYPTKKTSSPCIPTLLVNSSLTTILTFTSSRSDSWKFFKVYPHTYLISHTSPVLLSLFFPPLNIFPRLEKFACYTHTHTYFGTRVETDKDSS